MAHTPTPWALEILPASAAEYREWQIVSDEGHNIRLHVALLSSPEDAAFIVRAVNAHEPLVEALEELGDALEDGLCNSGTPGFDSDRLDRARDTVRAALSLAKGEAEK